jgi:SAM-dependent methyltransferase
MVDDMPSQFQRHAQDYYRAADRSRHIGVNLTRFRAVLDTASRVREPYRIGHAVQALDRFDEQVTVRGLDYGCGDGIFVAETVRRRGWDVVGIDSDETLIAAARAWFPDVATRLMVGDVLASKLPFGEAELDFVFCNSVIQHFDHMEAEFCFRDIGRVLRPRGLLILTFKENMGKEGWSQPPNSSGSRSRVLHLFDIAEVTQFARRGKLTMLNHAEGSAPFRYLTKDGFTQVTVLLERRER